MKKHRFEELVASLGEVRDHVAGRRFAGRISGVDISAPRPFDRHKSSSWRAPLAPAPLFLIFLSSMPNPIFTPTNFGLAVHPRRQAPPAGPGVAPPAAPDAVPAPPPEAFLLPQPRGSRRLHADSTVGAVRWLIEHSRYSYREISKRTGVAPASICRWMRDGNWQRPFDAPRVTHTVPRWRVSGRLKRWALAARLRALAERLIAELEAAPNVDPEKLGEALALLQMAKLAVRPRRPRTPRPGAARAPNGRRPEQVIADLRANGVDVARAPKDALADYVETELPPPPRKRRQARPRRRPPRAAHHAWMLEKG